MVALPPMHITRRRWRDTTTVLEIRFNIGYITPVRAAFCPLPARRPSHPLNMQYSYSYSQYRVKASLIAPPLVFCNRCCAICGFSPDPPCAAGQHAIFVFVFAISYKGQVVTSLPVWGVVLVVCVCVGVGGVVLCRCVCV